MPWQAVLARMRAAGPNTWRYCGKLGCTYGGSAGTYRTKRAFVQVAPGEVVHPEKPTRGRMQSTELSLQNICNWCSMLTWQILGGYSTEVALLQRNLAVAGFVGLLLLGCSMNMWHPSPAGEVLTS